MLFLDVTGGHISPERASKTSRISRGLCRKKGRLKDGANRKAARGRRSVEWARLPHFLTDGIVWAVQGELCEGFMKKRFPGAQAGSPGKGTRVHWKGVNF